jgi:hypothetical protein
MPMFQTDLAGCVVRIYPWGNASDFCSKGLDLNSCPMIGQYFSICHSLSTIIQIALSNGCIFCHFSQPFISVSNNSSGQNYSSENVHPVKMYSDFFLQELKNCLLGSAASWLFPETN